MTAEQATRRAGSDAIEPGAVDLLRAFVAHTRSVKGQLKSKRQGRLRSTRKQRVLKRDLRGWIAVRYEVSVELGHLQHSLTALHPGTDELREAISEARSAAHALGRVATQLKSAGPKPSTLLVPEIEKGCTDVVSLADKLVSVTRPDTVNSPKSPTNPGARIVNPGVTLTDGRGPIVEFRDVPLDPRDRSDEITWTAWLTSPGLYFRASACAGLVLAVLVILWATSPSGVASDLEGVLAATIYFAMVALGLGYGAKVLAALAIERKRDAQANSEATGEGPPA